MNKISFAIISTISIMPLIAWAQSKEDNKTKEPSTKLEAFLAKKGKLIIKNGYRLGEVSGKYGTKIVFEALVIYEPGQESERIKGLIIYIFEDNARYKNSNNSFLDLEEIESLSKAIEYMTALSTKWKGISKEYTEVIFSTRGNFKIGFYQQGTERQAFSSSGYIGEVSCFFPTVEDLTSIKALTDTGLKILKEK